MMNKQELTATYRLYVEAVAKQYQNQSLTMAQLIEAGNRGLAEAAERFDSDKDHSFTFMSYAIWWVRRGILDALAAVGRGEPIPTGPLLTGAERTILRSFERGETISQIAADRDQTEEVVRKILTKAMERVKHNSTFAS